MSVRCAVIAEVKDERLSPQAYFQFIHGLPSNSFTYHDAF